jgi:hypothetical protein
MAPKPFTAKMHSKAFQTLQSSKLNLNALWRLGGSILYETYLTAKRHSKPFEKIQTRQMDFRI